MEKILLKDGEEICLHNFDEVISNEVKKNKNYFEFDFLNYIKENYSNQNEILDIGANIGNHSLFFARYLKYNKIHCFEPFDKNIFILKENIKNYNIEIYQFALSNIEGELPLFNSQNENYGGFSLHSYANNSSFKVLDKIKVRKLDSLNLSNISMIKIDVENHENEVLEGAKNTILNNKPIIFIENLHHGYPKICPNPDPHKKILEEYNYYKKESNIKGSFMDLWLPK